MNCCDENDLPPSESNAMFSERPVNKPKPWRRRAAELFQWMLPVTILALIPKCPMCIAAYVLLCTGVGLSLTAAAAIRWILIALSFAALAWLSLRAANRLRLRYSAFR